MLSEITRHAIRGQGLLGIPCRSHRSSRSSQQLRPRAPENKVAESDSIGSISVHQRLRGLTCTDNRGCRSMSQRIKAGLDGGRHGSGQELERGSFLSLGGCGRDRNSASEAEADESPMPSTSDVAAFATAAIPFVVMAVSVALLSDCKPTRVTRSGLSSAISRIAPATIE